MGYRKVKDNSLENWAVLLKPAGWCWGVSLTTNGRAGLVGLALTEEEGKRLVEVVTLVL